MPIAVTKRPITFNFCYSIINTFMTTLDDEHLNPHVEIVYRLWYTKISRLGRCTNVIYMFRVF